MRSIITLIFAVCVFPTVSISQVIDTIYFNADWKTSNKSNAQYFRKVYAKDKSGVYKVDDCYINGTVQMSGGSLDPYADNDEPFREGKFLFYDSLGRLTSEEYYSKGMHIGKWLSYFTGKSNVSRELNFENDSVTTTVYYYLSGLVESKGKQIKGKNEGEWRYFYNEKDKLAEIKNFLHGKQEGVMQEFDSLTNKKIADGFYIDDKKEGEWKSYYSDGRLFKEVSLRNDTRNGFEVEYDSASEKMKVKVPYVNDTVNGVVQQFDLKTGILLSEGKVEKGKKVGTWKTYYPGTTKIRIIKEMQLDSTYTLMAYDSTGVLISKGQGVRDTVKEGMWEVYSRKNGKLVSKIMSHNGKLEGHAEFYDAITGIKYAEGEHVKGARLGKWTFYFHVGGKLKSTETYTGMILDGPATYYDSLSLKLTKAGDYKKGKKNGKWLYYNDDGKLVGSEQYSNGLLSGELLIYDNSGGVVCQFNFVDNVKEGNWRIYYPGTKQIWIDYNCKRDSIHGLFKSYYQSGSLKRNENYDMGKKLDSKCYTSSGEETECLPIITNATFKTDVMTYIGDNLTYPESAKVKGTEGKVLVRFIVNENGRVSDAEVIQGIDKECDAEALRLVSQMPPWTPAQIDGMPYKTYETLPIVYWVH